MGTWGVGIRQDDFVLDVQDAFIGFLKKKPSSKAATQAIVAEFAIEIKDHDDGPLFWIALADVQWTFGYTDNKVIRQVKNDFKHGRGLELWRDASEKYYKGRVKALEKFIEKIEIPNSSPKKMPRTVVRKALYAAGDCLSIKLSSGQYGAAFVLVADNSDVEYGANLIGILDYHSRQKPTLDVFKKRKWLRLTDGEWKGERDLGWYTRVGYQTVKSRIERIGNLPLKKTDPTTSDWFHSWHGFGEQILNQQD